MNSSIRAFKSVLPSLLAFAFLFFTGCQTAPTAGVPYGEDNSRPDRAIILREGDALKINFPAAKELSSAQQIRRDGKIVLSSFGEVQAAGFTPAELEKHILEKVGDQLISKEVSVTLDASSYPVFVNGAVLRPGKIEAVRPITALEAIMEAGGFNYATANLKAVKVIRTQGSQVNTYILDFRGLLSGQATKPFYVRPSDIIFVPEKFTLF